MSTSIEFGPSTVNVQSEVHRQSRMRIRFSVPADHFRAEIRAADADVRDVSDLTAGKPSKRLPIRDMLAGERSYRNSGLEIEIQPWAPSFSHSFSKDAI
ncbi:hypothetical protein [Paraburkholderia youngii]|uniref:hypothetical protein n=1 Tax=Paraburkholderia youngii TaxID=2782701 RepID=UPI00403A6780